MNTSLSREKIREMYFAKYMSIKSETDLKISEGIEKNRKGDCRIRIVDGNGVPQRNVRVKISQMTHDFKYGANIFLLDEFETGEENEKYRSQFKELFNLATVPFYWDGLEPTEGKPRYAADSEKVYRRPAPDLCMEYCEQNGITPKLHCLYYDKFVPDWLKKLDDEAFHKKYEKRLSEIAERYSGRMFEMEVVNEMFIAPLRREMSRKEKEELVLARVDNTRRFLPDEKLTVNESQPFFNYTEPDGSNVYCDFCENLLNKGASIDRIGLQNHFFKGVTAKNQEQYDEDILRFDKRFFDPEFIFKSLDLFAKLGKPLEFTEVTIPTYGTTDEDEELQADILRLWYSIWFSHPAVDCIVYWNTVDGMAYTGDTWNENNCRGGLWRRDLTPKKSAIMLKKLFCEEWHTELELMTDGEGFVSFRGFYGDYIAESENVKMKFGYHKTPYHKSR